MALTTGSIIERIKQKLDIVEEIGAVVQLRKSGKSFKGLCPFHGERTPSFYVNPESGFWSCFGCHEHGDIFTFVEKQQGLDFREALEYLAGRAGIPLDTQSASEAREESAESIARKRLRVLNESAAIWFHSQLLQLSAAQYARAYIDSRGVSNDSLALWRLGYAPEGDSLTSYLLGQGYTPKELIEAGFTREREASRGGGLYDYFHNRLIFPIRDVRGQTVAFGGRELGGGHPKYLNTPQTALFDKSATLYGFDLARDAIKRADRVVIVEGYMDALVTHQYGTRNVVACIGSAITEKHIQQIKKLTRRVTLALDPDAAGEAAMVRGITVAQQAFERKFVLVPGAATGAPTDRRGAPKGVVRFEEQVDAEITVARLPPNEDPDEFVRRDPAGWQHAIETAQPLIDFLIEARTADLALDTPQGKLEATRRLLPVIAEVRDRTLSDDYVGRLAQKLRIDKVDLRRDLLVVRQRVDREARTRRASEIPPAADSENEAGAKDSMASAVESLGGKYQNPPRQGPVGGYSSSGAIETLRESLRGGVSQDGMAAGATGALLAEQALEAYCIGLLFTHPNTWTEMAAILEERDFTSPELRALFVAFATAVAGVAGTVAEVNCGGLLAALHPLLQETAHQAQATLTSGEEQAEGTPLAKTARDVAYRLKRMRLKAEMAELDALQRDAEHAAEADTLRTLLVRKQELLLQRRAIDSATALFG
ncbi:MAG: DNA primase [Ktedonobacterales bacterium]